MSKQPQPKAPQPDEELGDEYEHFNLEDKYAQSGHSSGKGRTKKEAEQNTNHPDPGGHTRKTTQKLMNSHEKEKAEHKKHEKQTPKDAKK